MQYQPTIRVIIPVRNAKEFLRISVESLLSEKIPGLQLVVIDDASTDSSLRSIEDLPVETRKLRLHRGVAHARNVGLEGATEDFILFFDSDDILVPGGIRWRLDWLLQHPEELAVGGYLRQLIDAKGKPVSLPLEAHLFPQAKPSRISWGNVTHQQLFPWSLSFYMFRRQLINEVGYLDTTFHICDDQDYLFRALRRTSIPFENLAVFDYRIHPRNISIDIKKKKILLKPKAKAESYFVFRQFGIGAES